MILHSVKSSSLDSDGNIVNRQMIATSSGAQNSAYSLANKKAPYGAFFFYST